jgi:hypothetical protein
MDEQEHLKASGIGGGAMISEERKALRIEQGQL